MDSLRRLVRSLQDENKKLKAQLNKANIAYEPELVHNLEIVDNYANHYDYGLYSHDDRNAILHALFMLVQLKKQDVSIEQKKLWLSSLRSDIENYFLCAKCGNGENIIFYENIV